MRNKHKHISFIVLFFVAVLISRCLTPRNKNVPSYADPGPGAVKAKVIRYEVDGCKWMLELEDGKKLQPLELWPEFQSENKKVWIIYQIQKDAMSNCMAGEIVKLTEIKERDK